jgi:Tfp pilus assembly protein PilN
VVQLQVAVNEDVELYLILGFGSLVGFLIVIGVIRTLRRKTIENQATA